VDWDLHAMVDVQLADVDLDRQFLSNHLAWIEVERAQVARVQDETFRAIVAPHLENVLLDGRQRLRAMSGIAHHHAVIRVSEDLRGQLAMAESLEGRMSRCVTDTQQFREP
jgi:hypothetical protein